MKVLLVGGAGYIGSHTARTLRRRGHEVVIFDNLSTGYRSLAAGFELVVGDVRDREPLGSVLKGIAGIVHFAAHAYVGESVSDPRKYFDNNVAGGLTLLNAALDAGIRYIVFSSSCAVYGEVSRIPIDEGTPRQPINAYGMSKLFFENALAAYDVAYGMRSACLRYFNAAGADEAGGIGELHNPETHVIPLAIAAARGRGPRLRIFGDDYPTEDGTCVRDYVHVNDLADAHMLALEHLAAGGGSIAVNLGTGRGHSVRALLTKIEEITGGPVSYDIAPRRPGDPPTLVADASLAERTLGWRASRSLDDIIRTAWAWSESSQRTNLEISFGSPRVY
jgi:UDP-glucose-4-epimerase GalE